MNILQGINLTAISYVIKIGWFTKLSASEDLRQSTSHETDGKADTRKGLP